MVLPPGFERVHEARVTWLVRTDTRSWLAPLVRGLGTGTIDGASSRLPGGRGGSRVVRVGAHDVVVRHLRRGGLPARFLHDTYCGWHPRPFRELCHTEALRAAGVPVVEVYAAVVRWLLPGCYRGWLVTRYIARAQTLWEWTATAAPADARQAVFSAVGHAVRRLHDAGSCHPDLNLNNILVVTADPPGKPAVVLIDFDRPAWSSWHVGTMEADLTRLRRSAHKLDPEERRVGAPDLACLEAAYRSSESECVR